MVELSEFFRRLDEFHTVRQTDQRNVLERGLRQISAALPELLQNAKAYEARVSPRFNIYRILRLERKEVLVHTPILAELLNPAGTHGQGFLFLNSFLLMLERHGQKPFAATQEEHQWFVESEKPTYSHGNLDVLVTCPRLGCLIVIENKIGAQEREDQIWDYWCWMRKRIQQFPHQRLIFLTPDGREAHTAQVAEYMSLSYHSDICSWLENIIPQVKSPTVRETICQYLQIIEYC
jgi:hypothetical protein